MEKRKFRRNESGAVLLTVLCIMTVMIILVGAAVSFVNQTTQKTYRTFQEEQAYMTASSCLESFVSEIEKSTNSATAGSKDNQKKAIEYLELLADENGGKGYEYDVLINGSKDIDKMGSCTIRVSRYNANTIVITSTAKFGSETDQTAAYVYTQTMPKKATFTNAIELCQDNGIEFNNLNVLGDMATIRGSDKDQNYTLTNQFKVYGSSYIYGNVTAVGNGESKTNYLMPSRTQDQMGSFMTISGDFTTNNNYYLRTTMDWGQGYNYLNVGGTFTIGDSQPQIGGQTMLTEANKTVNADKDIDVFAHNVVINGGKYLQQGNLCVYRNENESANGNLTVTNANGIEIWGDVLVDGDILLGSSDGCSIIVHGKVEYCGSIKRGNNKVVSGGYWDSSIPPWGAWVPEKYEFEVNGSGYTHAQGATELSLIGNQKIKADKGIFKRNTLSKVDRTKRPDISPTLIEYEYFPEDLIMNDDSKIGLLKSQYTALYSGSAKTLSQIFDSQSGDISYFSDGVTSHYRCLIEESCILDAGCFSHIKTAKSGGGGGNKILVHITDKDIVLLLKGGAGADSNFNMIVKNDSSPSNPHFCYIVSDSGTAGTIDNSITTPNTCKWSGFNTNTYTFENCAFFDYYTYINMFEQSELNKTAGTLVDGSPAIKPGFILNSTSQDVPGTFKPRDASLFFLFTKGNTLNFVNASYFEAIFYGPDASYFTATQGVNGVQVQTADGVNPWKICSLGMIIAGNFKNSNESAYLFKPPAEGSALSIVKGAKTDELYGYKLLRYDHH